MSVDDKLTETNRTLDIIMNILKDIRDSTNRTAENTSITSG